MAVSYESYGKLVREVSCLKTHLSEIRTKLGVPYAEETGTLTRIDVLLDSHNKVTNFNELLWIKDGKIKAHTAQIQDLKNRTDQLDVQLAGCLTAAEGWAGKCEKGMWGWSPAFEAVRELRNKFEDILKRMEHASFCLAVPGWAAPANPPVIQVQEDPEPARDVPDLRTAQPSKVRVTREDENGRGPCQASTAHYQTDQESPLSPTANATCILADLLRSLRSMNREQLSQIIHSAEIQMKDRLRVEGGGR